MRRLRTLSLLLLALALLVPGRALAGSSEDYLDVYKAYQAAGTVDGCKFTAKKLASAKAGVPPDVDTYAPDFPDALDAALRQRAGGDCEKRGGAAGTKDGAGGSAPATAGGSPAASAPGASRPGAAAPAAPPAGATGTAGAAPATTPAPAPEVAAAAATGGAVAAAAGRSANATSADDAPFPLVLLALVFGLGLLLALLWALARFIAFDPPWMAAGRHATAEAGWRASASWAEFTDWVRLGR